MEDKGIKISPNFYQKDWNDLNLSGNSIYDWNKAIAIFEDRMNGRYFKQIEALDTNKDISIKNFSGFAILSLSCLLIETLEQFWNGNFTTKKLQNKRKESWFKNLFCKNRNISNDAMAFHSFFQRSVELKKFFDTPEKSNVFYTKIRCGLLHQGQTKGKSLIHIRKNEPILKWINENDLEEGISIQRRLFINEIVKVYEDYLKELRNPNSLNFRRKTLAKKMKFIVDQK